MTRWLLTAACAHLAVTAGGSAAMAAGGADARPPAGAATGTGGGPGPAGGAASGPPSGAPASPEAVQAAYRAQRAHCLALPVSAVRDECLRQAERDRRQRLPAWPKPRS